MTALERLERFAKKHGWSFRWAVEPVPALPGMVCTSLDIREGKRLVTLGPVTAIHHERTDRGREACAEAVIDALRAERDRRAAR